MSGASLGNFIKHLACTLYAQLPRGSRRMLHQSHFYSSSSSIVFRRPSSPTARFGQQWRPCSLAASVSSKAASQNSSTVSGVPPYSSVLIRCRKDVADVLSEALLSFGASSVSMDEHDDYENSDKVSICSIFTDCEDVDACISHAADSIGLEETPTFEVLKYNPYDWIKRTQESFDPVEVTKGLWIVPVWKTPLYIQLTASGHLGHERNTKPWFGFRTGEHATTKLCLLVLHRSIRGGELFLDYGTGSGILSIAALKLGAALSVGVDIDPQAITAAHQNALLNNIEPDKLKLHLVSGNDSPILRDPELQKFVRVGIPADKNAYDVVIANILLNPLLDLADEIVSHAKHGAVVGLSGILSEQVDLVIECYSRFLENITVSEKDDWACVTGTRIRS